MNGRSPGLAGTGGGAQPHQHQHRKCRTAAQPKSNFQWDHHDAEGIASHPEMEGPSTAFPVAMRPGKHRAWPDPVEGRLQVLIESAKAQIRCKGEHPFRVIKLQFCFQTLQRSRLNGCRPAPGRSGRQPAKF